MSALIAQQYGVQVVRGQGTLHEGRTIIWSIQGVSGNASSVYDNTAASGIVRASFVDDLTEGLAQSLYEYPQGLPMDIGIHSEEVVYITHTPRP